MLYQIKSIFKLNFFQQFRLASLIILVAGMLGIGAWVVQQIEDGVVRSTSITTSLYVESFFEPILSELAQAPNLSPENIARLDDLVVDTPLGQQIVSLKVWSTGGKVLYDTNHADIGQTFPIEERLARSAGGEVTTRISSLDSEENAAQRSFGQLIETYSPLHLGGSQQIIGVIEFYQKMTDLQAIIDRAQLGSWVVVSVAGLIMYSLLLLFVQKASNTITAQQSVLQRQVSRLTELLKQNGELNDRVRNAARSFTTLNERLYRRVGAEFHDGPAQELSLVLLKLDGIIARNEQCQLACLKLQDGSMQGACAMDLNEVQNTLQQALQELRGIASGMSLPQLSELSLAETISRPVRAHERKTATRVDLRLEQLPDQAPLSVKITLYRLVQEALNNSFRHGGGIGQIVHAVATGQELKIEVADQGPGFDVDHWKTSEDHLGLAGMRERVESLGGLFSVESSAGQGTRIVAFLSLGMEAIAE